MLQIVNGADDAVPATHNPVIHAALATTDKELVEIAGATHYYLGQPAELADCIGTVTDWSRVLHPAALMASVISSTRSGVRGWPPTSLSCNSRHSCARFTCRWNWPSALSCAPAQPARLATAASKMSARHSRPMFMVCKYLRRNGGTHSNTES